MIYSSDTEKFSRRKFLINAVRLTAGMMFTLPFETQAMQTKRHPLSLYNTHTGETLDILFDPHRLPPGEVEKVCYFLRDFRTEDVHPIDLRLLDILCRIQRKTKSSGTFEVISGYRSPATNMRLRGRGKGVAKKSLHMEGRAIDVRLTDVATKKLRSIACSMERGGVGYYAKSNFIHLDTGRVRIW